jgi:hypothetical protein
MKNMCRSMTASTWRTRQLAVTELLRHATVVTDPTRLAYLNAEVAKNKATPKGAVIRVRSRPKP